MGVDKQLKILRHTVKAVTTQKKSLHIIIVASDYILKSSIKYIKSKHYVIHPNMLLIVGDLNLNLHC